MNSNEEYVLNKAREALKKGDIEDAKIWIIISLALFPNSFYVQFEAYKIEKLTQNAAKAAKCLRNMISKLDSIEKDEKKEIWSEIEQMTLALKAEDADKNQKFLSNMFDFIPEEIQRQILIQSAENCEDTMEHCRLLLLLLKRFPETVPVQGLKLVDTLMLAEKHIVGDNFNYNKANPYRKVLVYELLPIICQHADKIKLPFKWFDKLLNKTIGFYFSYIIDHKTNENLSIDQAWTKLFSTLESIGQMLNWDSNLISYFHHSWNKELYWQKIVKYCEKNQKIMNNEQISKQILYTLTLFFLYCLYDYHLSCSNQVNMVLIESFSDMSIPLSSNEESLAKRRKEDYKKINSTLTIDNPKNNKLIDCFKMAVACWDYLNELELINQDYLTILRNINIPGWYNKFLVDHAMFKQSSKGEIFEKLSMEINTHPKDSNTLDHTYEISQALRIISVLFSLEDYSQCFERIQYVVSVATTLPAGQLSKELLLKRILDREHERHFHFLSLTSTAVLQYCAQTLITGIKDNMSKMGGFNDLSMGNLLVLVQMDWPQQEYLVQLISEAILKRGAFHFPLLQAYVINMDILEELMFLHNGDQNSPSCSLDIFIQSHSTSHRRLGTRGSDKGLKDEFKQSMRRQIQRSDEPIDQLLIKFIIDSKVHLMQTFVF